MTALVTTPASPVGLATTRLLFRDMFAWLRQTETLAARFRANDFPFAPVPRTSGSVQEPGGGKAVDVTASYPGGPWTELISPQSGEKGREKMSETTPHILCVDDEQDILSVAKLSLETVGGYQVSTCSSGVEAVERAGDIKPDLILLDVMMPEMGGPATLLKLKANAETAATPVVFMTARVQPSEIAEYLALGASAVVHKPFDPMLLAGQIGDILKQSRPN